MTATRLKYAEGTGTSLTVTFTETPALDNTHGLIAAVRSYAGSSVDPTPTTPSGWTLVTGGITGTTYRTWLGIYAKRGDGTANSITVASANSSTKNIELAAYAHVSADTFWETPNGTTDKVSTSGGTSLALTSVVSTAAGETAVACAALGSTAGGAGFTWTDSMIQRQGASQYAAMSFAEKDIATSGTAETTTVTWTTSGIARATILMLKTAAPPVAGAMVRSIVQTLDYSSWSNVASMDVTQNSGTDVSASITVAGLTATFNDPITRTDTIALAVTLTGLGGSLSYTVLVPPVAPSGVRERVYDGTGWV